MRELYYAKVLEWKELDRIPEKTRWHSWSEGEEAILLGFRIQSRPTVLAEHLQTLAADAIVTSLSPFSGSRGALVSTPLLVTATYPLIQLS